MVGHALFLYAHADAEEICHTWRIGGARVGKINFLNSIKCKLVQKVVAAHKERIAIGKE